ncbi:MAG: tetratricopeptide repeat protein [Alphaproteobacteria bacterium]|nr:tetratricopeptide repeat protein [Alphaproteobacteria bacterium]
MANEDSALREVDQELAEDRQTAMFRKYGPAALAAGISLVLAVGGWQFWNARIVSVAKEKALEYSNAIDLMVEDADQGRTALGAIAEDGASGYAILAELQRASSYARDGDRAAAIGVYRQIYENNNAPKRIRDLARLRASYAALNDGRDAVISHLGDLPNEDGAFAYHAAEVSGLAALEARDYETALSIFRQLSIDLGAPEAVRTRAEDFAALADAGKAGVNITGQTRVDELLKAIGAAPADADVVLPAAEEVPASDAGDDIEASAQDGAEVETKDSETENE